MLKVWTNIQGGPQKKQNLFIKNSVFLLTCLHFSRLQSTLHLMQYTSWDFFHCSKQVLNSSVLMPFSGAAFFCLFRLFHISKMFPCEDIFHPRKQQKITQGEIGWIGRVRHRIHAVFGQKLLNTQHGVGRCAREMGKHIERIFKKKKKIIEAHRGLSPDSTSWYTDTDGSLAHSPSGGNQYYKRPTLQKTILFLGVLPHTSVFIIQNK